MSLMSTELRQTCLSYDGIGIDNAGIQQNLNELMTDMSVI